MGFINISSYNKTRCILLGVCDCKAGDVGFCENVGAHFYTLEKTKNTCTSEACQWGRQRNMARKPSPKRIKDITFARTDKDNKTPEKIKPYPCTSRASARVYYGDVFSSELVDGVQNIYPSCVLYKTLRTEQSIDSFL